MNLDILLVDDDAVSREINKDILEEKGANVTEASDGEEALKKFRAMPLVDAILMDVHMPKMDGIEATRCIREREESLADRVPIIAFSADSNLQVVDKMLEAGADGVIQKPLDINELTRILLAGMRRRTARMEKKLAESVRAANIDHLTKLRNLKAYRNLTSAIDEEINSAFPPEFAIIMCDVNNLKTVNDTRGHELGDQYIKNCCKLVCDVFPHSPVFRIGGDEFVVILRGLDYENREELMSNLLRKTETANAYDDVLKGKASVAAGISVFNHNTDKSVDDVARRADEEMYKNKKTSKERQKLQ